MDLEEAVLVAAHAKNSSRTGLANSCHYREMYMNALLYYPFGLSLTVLIGPWSILISFILSILIELWQYLAGTGVAQGTDVIMNSLGAAIGALPWIIVYFLKKHTSSESSSD